MTNQITRRSLLSSGAGALAGMAAMPALTASKSSAAETAGSTDGTYPTAPLRSDTVNFGVVQSRVHPVDASNTKQTLKKNLDHMLWLIDRAQYYGGHKDFLAFHEFPLTGWDRWTRSEILSFAPELPGEETEAIGAKAREHNCYISFGTYAQYKDWPRHIMSVAVVIGPDGEIVSQQWKARNIHGVFVGFELFTTSVYEVLERYVEMYGWDAVIPVARTSVGNICISPCKMEPELYRAMSIKGAEIIIRTSTGGYNHLDMRNVCQSNKVYGALSNNAVSPGNKSFFETAGGGGSVIIGPDGKILAEVEGHHEELINYRLPMADFRSRHRIPDFHSELYAHVLDGYKSRYAPGAFLDYLPEGLDEAYQQFKEKARW